MIANFSDKDWNELLGEVLSKSIEWQIKLANCVGEIENEFALNCLLLLVEVENDELFEACIDSLRNFDELNNGEFDVISIKNKIEKIIPRSGNVSKIILRDFMNNLKHE